MNQIKWCLKQKKGIKIISPNENISQSYFDKANDSLSVMLVSPSNEWKIITAYYSCYNAFYALLQKVGIKSEIHDCTINLMHFLFVEEDLIKEQFYTELVSAKDLRIETQYYFAEEIDLTKLKEDSETARSFVLNIVEVIENISENQIAIIRNKLNSLTKTLI